MTRTEQIVKATKEFYPIPDTECLAAQAFLVGANWADEYPKSP